MDYNNKYPSYPVSLGCAPNGEGVGLCVEDPPIQWKDRVIIREEEEEVLEGLPWEEALHLVSWGRVLSVLYIVD